jgi:hypothetical protein
LAGTRTTVNACCTTNTGLPPKSIVKFKLTSGGRWAEGLMVKQICTAFLLAFLRLSGVAQESAVARVAIPLIATDSQHRLSSVTGSRW